MCDLSSGCPFTVKFWIVKTDWWRNLKDTSRNSSPNNPISSDIPSRVVLVNPIWILENFLVYNTRAHGIAETYFLWWRSTKYMDCDKYKEDRICWELSLALLMYSVLLGGNISLDCWWIFFARAVILDTSLRAECCNNIVIKKYWVQVPFSIKSKEARQLSIIQAIVMSRDGAIWITSVIVQIG